MAYTVSVAMNYRPDCPSCIEEAERIGVQGIRDRSVTCITLRAASKCEHETPASMTAAIPPTRPEPRIGVLPGFEFDSRSDTNGFDTSVLD